MFKFNFNIDPDELEAVVINETNDVNAVPTTATTDDANDNNKLTEENEDNNNYGIIELDELNSNDYYETNKSLIENSLKKFNLDKNQHIEYLLIDNSDLLDKLNLNKNLIEINKTHDVLKGKYEGGLKIWECSIDLARYLFNSLSLETIQNNNDELTFIELGCGHALPSLSLLKAIHQSSKFKTINVYLQDYNRDCLESVTYINLKHFLLKHEFKDVKLNVKFVYGSWKYLNKILPNFKFDLILTSETIYNRFYYKDLLDLCKYLLKTNKNENNNEDEIKHKKFKYDEERISSSFILLAAKTYYFGCGGNLYEFLNLAKSNEYKFKCTKNLIENMFILKDDRLLTVLLLNDQDQSKIENDTKTTTANAANAVTTDDGINYLLKDQNSNNNQINNSISREIIKMFL